MIFSVPSYRRLSEEDLARLDKDDPRSPTRRLTSALLNIFLLAGLWGVPLYGRSVVLSAMDERKSAPEFLVGSKWRTTDGSHFQVAFTREGQFVLSWKEAVVATARYSFHEGDEIVLSDFRKLDERVEQGAIPEDGTCWFGVSWGKGKLSITDAFYWEGTRIRFRPGAGWRIGGERLALPPAFLERIE